MPQLKSEICPRISAQDLLHVCELNGNEGTSGTRPQNVKRKRGLVLDVRPADEYPLNSRKFHLHLHRAQSVVTDHAMLFFQPMGSLTSRLRLLHRLPIQHRSVGFPRFQKHVYDSFLVITNIWFYDRATLFPHSSHKRASL